MKLKEFKKFINNIDEQYDELEVVYPTLSRRAIKVEDFITFRNCICLSCDYKNGVPFENGILELEM